MEFSKKNTFYSSFPKAMWFSLWILAILVEITLLLKGTPFFPRIFKTDLLSPTQIPIAQLNSVESEVQHQHWRDLLWQDAQNQTPIFPGDRILTHPDSSTFVSFGSGESLQIGEQSLIQIPKDYDSTDIPVLRLLEGNLTIGSKAKGLFVQMGKQTVQINPHSSIQIEQNDSKQKKIKLTFGKVSVNSHAGTQTFDAPIEIISQNNEWKPKIHSFQHLSPMGEVFEYLPGRIKFEWESKDPLKATLLLSEEVHFQKSFSVTGKSPLIVSLPKKFKNKKIYWKLSQEKNESPVASISVLPPRRVDIKSPNNRTETVLGQTIVAEAPIKDIRSVYWILKWGNQKKTFTSKKFKWKPKKAGTAILFFKAYTSSGEAYESPKTSFKIKKKPALLPPPRLKKRPTFQPKTSRLNLFKKLMSFFIPSAHAEKLSWDVLIEWQPVTHATGYRLQIARTRRFHHILTDKVTDKTVFHWSYQKGMENSKGRVFYRIATINRDGKPGKFSSAQVLSIPLEILTYKKKEKVFFHDWNGSVELGYGTFTQKSSSDTIRSLKNDSLSFHQKITLGYENPLLLIAEEFEAFSFEKSETIQLAQTSGSAFRSVTFIGTPWKSFFLGGSILLNPRFFKNNPQSVSPRYGISFGPSIRQTLNFSFSSPFLPKEMFWQLELPFLGYLWKHQSSVRMQNVFLWNLKQWDFFQLNLKWGIEFFGERWKAPENTWTWKWDTWLGFQFKFLSSR